MNIYDIKTLTEVFVHNEGGEIAYKLDGKYGQVGTVVKVKDKTYFLFYKKRWFETFSKFYTTFNCVGIGLSMKHIELAAKADGIVVLFITDKEYRIKGKLIKEFVEKHNTRKYYEADDEWIGNIAATYLERNMIVKQTVDSQFERYMD